MRAQPAGKESVAISHVNFILARAAGGAQRTGDNIGPVVDIVLRVADHRRFTRRAGGRMNAHHLSIGTAKVSNG
ncbi:hypothetical protein D3C71_1388320 [compost metagenome]